MDKKDKQTEKQVWTILMKSRYGKTTRVINRKTEGQTENKRTCDEDGGKDR